ncbi:hypothetical protein ACI77O_11940 [Pseudomonas tritici]|uniref:hypothetical protein n=1 Tax=Pseudomonas tritici TaxID=2745518 RepID=UPI00387B06D6
MSQIYTRQAQAFLVPEVGLYNRPPPHQLVPFMVRMSGVIRSTSAANKTAAIRMVEGHVFEAWGKIHREMRDYFFTDIEAVTRAYSPYQGRAIDLPVLADLDKIHQSLHFCFDVLVDLDRMTMLLHSDSDAVEVSDRVLRCWNALYRVTARSEGLENRIKSGKSFNGAV